MRVFYYFNPYNSGKGDYDKKEPVILNNILEKQRIKVSKVLTLNDPFDFQVSFSPETPKGYVKGFRDVFNKYNETNALISFSTDIYNVLMWSHYAAEHYGYALELELEPRLLTRVNYSLIAPEIGYSKQQDQKDRHSHVIRSVLKTKSIDWAYEKEWRMIFWDCPNNEKIQEEPQKDGTVLWFYPLPQGSLKSIFIGLRCKKTESDLRAQLTQWGINNVHVYKMRQDKTGFSLACEQYERDIQIRQFCRNIMKSKKGNSRHKTEA